MVTENGVSHDDRTVQEFYPEICTHLFLGTDVEMAIVEGVDNRRVCGGSAHL
ncbi:hypothetical protein GCM10025794_37800 [Massilia kyonggiensis]